MMATFAVCITVLAGLVTPVMGQAEDVRSERPPGEGPTRVEVMLYLMDLMKVIDTEETFEADLFVLARWSDPRLAGERKRVVPIDQVWFPNVLIFNKRDASSDLPRTVEIQPDGTVTYRQRLTGTFASMLDLSRFPLDSQTLEIRLVVYGTTASEVLLVESDVFPASYAPDLTIADWDVGELETLTGTFSPTPGGSKLSTLTVRLDVTRRLGYYIVQMLIPLVLIVGMSWVPFWIDPKVIPARTGVSVTAVLTLIAYRFMVGGFLPKLSYLTRMDFLLLGSTVLVAGALVTVAAGTHLVKEDQAESAARLDRWARRLSPAGFVLLLGGLALFG